MKALVTVVIVFWMVELFAQQGKTSEDWVLVWQDEFEFFDDVIWKKRSNFDHYGEAQVYLDENVYTQGGNLVLELKAEEYACPEWAVGPEWHCVYQFNEGKPYSYTAGWVESQQRFDTQFGFIEARIQFPFQKALTPAFWTFRGESASKKENAAEIDIAEMIGSLGKNSLTSNIHREYCTERRLSFKDGCPEIKDYFKEYQHTNFNWEDWHVYGLEWTPKKLKFYLDGKLIRTIKKHQITAPVMLIFNQGIKLKYTVDDTLMPQKMLVDYVRVYKEK